ncbi:MAG: hypothetical protein IE909_13355 [Campylobacterales bacterium]|nr:hypothetical protein [Campylobacterales bacterium]
MAIFEDDDVDTDEYLAILDVNGNMIGIFNPSSKEVPLEVYKKAFNAKGIKCEIRQTMIAPVEIIL